jgi:two-component system chemotaxis response regulator CheY
MHLDSNFLIVDDEPPIRKIVIIFLKKAGYINFYTAEDGAKALDIIKSNNIDIIISDWTMPNVTGIELLEAVRKNPDLKDIPFIMLTVEARKNNVQTAGVNHVSDYIIKPFSANTLLKKVADVLRRRSMASAGQGTSKRSVSRP